MKYKEITDKIIASFYKVYNYLGYGFLEKVYENALCIDFSHINLNFANQHPINVYYENKIIGNYCADFLIENKIIVEIKAIKTLVSSNESQLLNYLSATGFEVGLLLNFGEKPEIKRKVYSNCYKKYTGN